MRFATAASRQGFAIYLTVGLAAALAVALNLGGLTKTVSHQAAAEEASAGNGGPREPTLHANLYRKLAAPVRVNFTRVALGDVLRQLTRATGVTIELVDPKMSDWQVTLTKPNPVTLQKAIQMALRQGGNCCMTLNDKGVRIIHLHEASNQYVLETHQLWSASNYSSQMRTRFIEQVRRDIAGADWGRADGPWIVPSRSVFAVDVYHTPRVQRQIDKLWQREYVEKRTFTARDSESLELVRALDKKTATPEEIGALAERLRKKYPFVSLGGRLAYERDKSAAERPAIADQVERRLTAGEEAIERRSWPKSPGMNVRALSLKQLHGDEVEKFITSPGFGESRMPSTLPGPEALQLVQLTSHPLPSAEIDPPSAELPVRLDIKTPTVAAGPGMLPALDRLENLHQFGLKSFFAPLRFGYVQDREHVAGFGSHGFEDLPRLEYVKQSSQVVAATESGEVPLYPDRSPRALFDEPTEQWAIRRLELVSLLKHDTPQAYVSNHLPRMDALQEAPTRPLNEFETDAMPRLVESEDIVARATTNRIEMMGAIRAARQCTACHEVERGQLLGAFSYTLVRDPSISPLADGTAKRSESIAQ